VDLKKNLALIEVMIKEKSNSFNLSTPFFDNICFCNEIMLLNFIFFMILDYFNVFI
jgi:hypothetical protein